MFRFQYQNGKKLKTGKNFSRLQNGTKSSFQIGAGFRDYKLGQERLQKQGALENRRRGEKIRNQGRDYKLVQKTCHKTLLCYMDSFIPDRLLQEKYN